LTGTADAAISSSSSHDESKEVVEMKGRSEVLTFTIRHEGKNERKEQFGIKNNVRIRL
jgi:uncharacterized OB-fold protein